MHNYPADSMETDEPDTLVYPLLQMYTFGIRQDEQVMEKFLCMAENSSQIKLASGYFNLTNHYMNIILKSSKAIYSLLVASPKVCFHFHSCHLHLKLHIKITGNFLMCLQFASALRMWIFSRISF